MGPFLFPKFKKETRRKKNDPWKNEQTIRSDDPRKEEEDFADIRKERKAVRCGVIVACNEATIMRIVFFLSKEKSHPA